MNNLLNKMDRRLGKYAVPNLIVYLLGGYRVCTAVRGAGRAEPDDVRAVLHSARTSLEACYLGAYAAGFQSFICRYHDDVLLSAWPVVRTHMGGVSV